MSYQPRRLVDLLRYLLTVARYALQKPYPCPHTGRDCTGHLRPTMEITYHGERWWICTVCRFQWLAEADPRRNNPTPY